jgi:hypothetical protein
VAQKITFRKAQMNICTDFAKTHTTYVENTAVYVAEELFVLVQFLGR